MYKSLNNNITINNKQLETKKLCNFYVKKN